jgi:glycosyltransferase involved in cell wall biosynthesis
MKVLIISSYTQSLVNFRGDLIKYITKLGHEVIATAPELDYENQIKELGARFVNIQFNRAGTNPLKDISYTISLYKLIKKEKPDLVFAYTTKPIIYGPIAAKLARVNERVSLVTGFSYVYENKNLKEYILVSIIKFLNTIGFKLSTKVIFQNPDDMNECVNSKLVNQNKCSIVNGSGVNLERFVFSPITYRNSFLMIGRILVDKGVIEYLDAARIVKKRYPNVKFVLLGPFDANPNSLNYESIKPYIDDNTVEYVGEQIDVRPYILNCSVKVLPSYHEGVPRSVLEAMSMGRAVVTTDAPGCRETVVDGINGFIVPVKSVDILAEKMLWMIEHPDIVEKMGLESYRICSEKFDVRKINQRMVEILNLSEGVIKNESI